jgi:gamma-glutamyltranspeptidase/glutathione hydrolase
MASMTTRYAPNGAVAAAHHLAAQAGAAMLERGGTAADAAVATAAAMAVTSPHLCGVGGDMFAVVVGPGGPPAALNASGRAGSGADAARLRSSGLIQMPFRDDINTVTVPGFIDGITALHARFGSLALGDVLAPAIGLAREGFPVSVTLADASQVLAPAVRVAVFGAPDPLVRGRRLTVPGIGGALADVADGGRDAFYEGGPGRALRALGHDLFSEADLRTVQADWVAPLSLRAFGRHLWTIPPNSQGYLALASAWIAEQVGVPEDPADDAWAFVLVEAVRQAAHDRVAALHDQADGAALISPERLAPRAQAIRDEAGRGLADVYRDGDTTYLCAVDGDRMGVSLIMSNASGFGSHLVLEEHGIFLHNRGMGFSLQDGHPAAFGPGRRPPHTLSPIAVTGEDGSLDAVLGTMGGDAQPQIVLQLLARMLIAGEDPGTAVGAPRWGLTREQSNGFDVWEREEPPIVALEHGAPPAWAQGLARRGYQIYEAGPGEEGFGHAQAIQVAADDILRGAADPRPHDGACVGL